MTRKPKNYRFVYITSVTILLTCSCNSQSKRLPTGLEIPAIRDPKSIVVHEGYTASFNSTYMIPNWVAYELTSGELSGDVRRPSNSPFRKDPKYKGKQPKRSDYFHSGWDKGHMAPCADMKWSEKAMIESFYFSNICPQNHDFNAGNWERLEKKARKLARSKDTLYIVCGPIIASNSFGHLGSNHVAIPDSFFKAFLYKDTCGYHSIAYLMPNRQTGKNLNEYSLSVNDLEAIIDLDLFTHLDPVVQDSVESQLVFTDWE